MKLRESAKISELSWKNLIWIGGLHILAIALAVPFFSWQALAAFAIIHYMTGMVGITFGFHRLLTHRSFQTAPWLENLAALCGTLACQGGPISWVATHRLHHMYSDKHDDPHNAERGFWYSHFGWILNRRQDLDQFDEFAHYAPDLVKRPFFVFLEKHMILVQNIFGWSLGLAAAIWFSTPEMGLNWFMGASFIVYCVFIRLVIGYHVTWFVNSAAHKWGSNPNGLTDLSRNNWWVGLLAFGEGWHNNHHAQPRSARHGWKWNQFDQTWLLIKFCKAIGLAKQVQMPKLRELRVSPQMVGSASGVSHATSHGESMVLAREVAP